MSIYVVIEKKGMKYFFCIKAVDASRFSVLVKNFHSRADVAWMRIAVHKNKTCCFNSMLCRANVNYQITKGICIYTWISHFMQSFSAFSQFVRLCQIRVPFCSFLFTCRTHRCIFLHRIKYSRFVIHFLVPHLLLF